MAALDNLQSKSIDSYPLQSYYAILCIDFSGLGLE